MHVDQWRYPPAFEGNPWSYGLALFSLTLICAVSLAVIIGYAIEGRRRREVDRLIANMTPKPLAPTLTPVSLHRRIVAGLLSTIVCGALPDVFILLAWGEAGPDTLDFLFTLDRLFDGLTIVPFLFSACLLVWAGQKIDHRLASEPIGEGLRISWFMVKDRLKMSSLILLIAIGVTYAKAVA